MAITVIAITLFAKILSFIDKSKEINHFQPTSILHTSINKHLEIGF